MRYHHYDVLWGQALLAGQCADAVEGEDDYTLVGGLCDFGWFGWFYRYRRSTVRPSVTPAVALGF